MGFREGMCPKCHELIQVPDDRDKILCMFCGQEIETEKAVDALKEHRELEAGNVTYSELYQEVKEDFVTMLERIGDPMKEFKKSTYEDKFKEYYRQNLYIIEAIEKAYCVAADKEGFLQSISNDFAAHTQAIIDEIPKKNKKEDYQLKCNMALVVYVIPAFIEYRGASSELLANTLVDTWNDSFDKTSIKVSSFEMINGGFKRRWCYITTAVCESLNKGDDCYELTLLRDYRDGYLMSSEGGETVIREYYDIAPTIVKRIDRKEDSREIYQGIYEQYLQPCIRLIEGNQLEECREVYTGMMKDLKEEYFLTNKLA